MFGLLLFAYFPSLFTDQFPAHIELEVIHSIHLFPSGCLGAEAHGLSAAEHGLEFFLMLRLFMNSEFGLLLPHLLHVDDPGGIVAPIVK